MMGIFTPFYNGFTAHTEISPGSDLCAWRAVRYREQRSCAGQANAINTPAIPKGKDSDIKLYGANGSAVVIGREALEQMPKAGLILWLAGNQFFAMDDVISAFQKHGSAISVGLITLPPGLLLQAIKASGWVYEDNEYRGQPDIYASVSLGHLQQLKASAMMDSYMVYMHNELQIMVAQGNPKKIAGVQDLARPDVRTSMPPITQLEWPLTLATANPPGFRLRDLDVRERSTKP